MTWEMRECSGRLWEDLEWDGPRYHTNCDGCPSDLNDYDKTVYQFVLSLGCDELVKVRLCSRCLIVALAGATEMPPSSYKRARGEWNKELDR